MTYKEYLIQTAAQTIAHLSNAIVTAQRMDSNGEVVYDSTAIDYLERALDVTPQLAEYRNFNRDRVGPRPAVGGMYGGRDK